MRETIMFTTADEAAHIPAEMTSSSRVDEGGQEKAIKSTARIKALKPHPRQAELFEDLPKDELRELADDIKANGLKNAIDILPDGTIVNGHQRVKACKLLGWKEIPVYVRHDWAQKGEALIEQKLIEDNLNRRHLDKLSLARCCQRLIELEKTEGRGKLGPRDFGDVRDRIAKRVSFGSGRTLDRYMQVLQTPIEVQRAFSGGKLKLIPAGKVSLLGQDKQQEIAAKIRIGGDPKNVVAAYLTPVNGRHKNVRDARNTFIRNLQRSLADLEGRENNIKYLSAEQAAVLEQGKSIIERILQQATAVTQTSKKPAGKQSCTRPAS